MGKDARKQQEQTKTVGEAEFELPDEALEDVAGGLVKDATKKFRKVTGGETSAQTMR